MNDLRFALRQLLKNPGFTVAAVLTLAICLGANLAIFAVVDGILIRPLPFPDADRLVAIHNDYPGAGIERGNASICNYFERREALDTLSSVSMFMELPYIVGQGNTSSRVETARVTPEFFRTLGVPLAMGREFTDGELTYETDKVAILTDSFWRSYFNADPHVLGRKFFMHTFPVTVIGVLPPDFRYLSSRAKIFRPFAHYRHRREPDSRHSSDGQMIARLAPNQSLARAQAQLDAFTRRQIADDPIRPTIEHSGYRARIAGLHQDQVKAVEPMLWLVQAGALCLLLIGIVNIAGLCLIHASGRAREINIRRAIGAGRRQIAVPIVAQTFLLALAGSLLGVFFAGIGVQLMSRLGVDVLPLGAQITLNGRITVLSLLTAIAMGVVIALPILWSQMTGSTVIRLHGETRWGTSSRGVQRLRHGFVIAQVTLAFVLLCAAGSLGVSFKRLLEKSPGFSPDQVLTAELLLPWEHYPSVGSRIAFVRRLQDRLHAQPGVTHAAVSSGLPFTFDGALVKAISTEESGSSSGRPPQAHYFSTVTPAYWRTMNIPLLRGRLFEESDIANSAQVAVIDEAVARQNWPQGDAIGHRFSTDRYDQFARKLVGDKGGRFVETEAYTVVGIVRNVEQRDLTAKGNRGTIYLPYTDSLKFQLVFRAAGSAHAMSPAVEKLIRELDPELPLTDFKSMRARMDDSLVSHRLPVLLAGAFATVALVLTAVGILGVLAYSVLLRRREIGVRMALGALPSQIGRQFIWAGMRLSMVGVVFGCIGTWATGRALQSLLVGVDSFHIPSVAVVTMVMCGATLVASLLPAIRATRISPSEVMKSE